MTTFTYYFVIDFEATGITQDSRTWEIVEFPITVVDARQRKTLECEFHSFVRPTEHPQLSTECMQKCGIAQATVDAAPPLAEVVQSIVEWVDQLALEGTAVVLTCGNYDLGTALRTESERKRIALPPWLRCWVNVKVPFEMGFGRRVGMKGMLEHLGLALDGWHHCGLDDARNIAKIAIELLQRGLPLEVTGGYSGGAPIHLGGDATDASPLVPSPSATAESLCRHEGGQPALGSGQHHGGSSTRGPRGRRWGKNSVRLSS